LAEFDFGPRIFRDGVLFRLWAPTQSQVALRIDGRSPSPLERSEGGWHTGFVRGAGQGTRYLFRMAGGLEVPDPASRLQPDDVHGASEVVDLDAYPWQETAWKGRPWEETVLYELHVGAFTADGTFRAAIDRLDHLRDIGVTALQIMPIGDFPGRYGWGYDGVLPYAPESSYGRPEDFMALIDAAHARGISVFLDVVYNHFGPEGNYLPAYAPLFNERHATPWGAGLNFDGEDSPMIREFVIQNAIYWIKTFRLDGLRLDAVHAIQDDGDEHLLHELARRVRDAAGERFVHIVAENENNDAALLERNGEGQPACFTAQWNDDIHHVLHVAATGERFAYYRDYEPGPALVGRALAEGFVFQGDHMPYRGEPRGTPSAHLPPTAFVSFIQNHDQIGNRAMGDRMAASQPVEAMKAIAAVYLLAPQVPMLFMGEEWGATEPFPYFCNLGDELDRKVREGRMRELSRLPGFDAATALDPTAESTFRAAKLGWHRGPEAAEMIEFYKELLLLRHRAIVPRLKLLKGGGGRHDRDVAHVKVEWPLGDGAWLRLAANLTSSAVPNSSWRTGGVLYALGDLGQADLAPWTVGWWLLV
jgi:malto-oligosyltrehalose trehalohydrolase